MITVRNLLRTDVTICRGIPTASVPLLLLHLAAHGPDHELEKALSEAQFRRIHDQQATRALLDRSRGRPGAAALRALIGEETLTATELERRMRALCRRARLPEPTTQVEIRMGDDTYRVDFAWPEYGLIVETDGREGHLTPAAFEEDRKRDAALTAAGWRVVRFTWTQVCERTHVIAVLRKLLG